VRAESYWIRVAAPVSGGRRTSTIALWRAVGYGLDDRIGRFMRDR
jgi:hypothetical protein